jgi:hypothetical protein
VYKHKHPYFHPNLFLSVPTTGKCYKVSRGDVGCDTDPKLLRWILSQDAPHLIDAPIFVASDHQRPELETAFAKAGAVFYRGACHSYDKQCMVIDAEIAARSAYFYGLHLSTAAQNIERFRRQRANGTPFKQQNAFPHIRASEQGPSAEEWTPMRWQGREAPEDYFASRPRESMDQVAVTVAPVPSPTEGVEIEIEVDVEEEELKEPLGNRVFAHDLDEDEDDHPKVGQERPSRFTDENVVSRADLESRALSSVSSSNDAEQTLSSSSQLHMVAVMPTTTQQHELGDGRSCHQRFDQWMAPMLWLALFVTVAYPHVQISGQYMVLRFCCWSTTLYGGMRRALKKKQTKKTVSIDPARKRRIASQLA